MKELAAAFGTHRNTIALILDRHISPSQLDQAIQLFAQGWSLGRIGEPLGFWDSTILPALRRTGVPTRDPQGRERQHCLKLQSE